MEAQNIALKKKVKQLESQICQRTRNYLYHFKKSPGKNKSSNVDAESQTDLINFQLLKKSSQIQQQQKLNYSFSNISCSQQKEGQKSRLLTPIKQKTKQFHAIQQNQQQGSQLKNNSKNMQSLTQQKQMNGQKLKADMQKFYSKEYRKLKRQIKKLKQHLQYEIQISTHTKEGLLISQEQNYKFRLQLQQLKRELKNFNQNCDSEFDKKSISQRSNNSNQKSEDTKEELNKYKTQNEKYQEMITHLQTVKSQYLSKCIKSKEQILYMKDQNFKLKLEIQKLKKALLREHEQSKEKRIKSENKLDEKSSNLDSCNWVQVFKAKVYQISNCLPLKQEAENFNLFKPQSTQQLLNMLDRILVFCKNIQKWEKDNIKAIQKQRSNLLTVLSTILVTLPNSKNVLANILIQIQQLSHLVNFINRNSRQNQNQLGLQKITEEYQHQKLTNQVQ